MKRFAIMIAAAVMALGLFLSSFAVAQVRPVSADLTVEDLGSPVSRRRLASNWLFKNPTNGDLHLLVSLGANNGWGDDPAPQMVDFNITAGWAREVETDYMGQPGGGWMHHNGKLYIGGARPPMLQEYDPDTGKLRLIGRTSGGFVSGTYSWDLAPDGWLYIGHYGGGLARYNPETDTLENLGWMLGGFEPLYIYTIAADDRYVYCCISKTWHLLTYDTETGRIEEWPDLTAGSGGARHNAEGHIFFGNRMMSGGRPVADNDIELALLEARPAPRNALLDFDQLEEESGIEFDISDINPSNFNGGRVTVRWRREGEEEWRENSFDDVDLVPNTVKSMAATPKGTLLGQSSSYGPIFEFDPRTGESKYHGPATGHIYRMSVVGDYAYLAAYRSQFWIYDMTKPFTLLWRTNEYTKGAERNPVNIGGPGIRPNLIAHASDGRVFVAGNHGRHRVGGDLIIYNPADGAKISLRETMEPYSISDMIALDAGRAVVWSARDREDGTVHYFIYDVEADELAKTMEVDLPAPGYMMPVGPSTVMGVFGRTGRDDRGAERAETFIYALDVETGGILWEKTVAGRPFAGPRPDEFSSIDRELVLGPDGCGWLFIDNNLTRIHPDGNVEKILEMEQGARLVFVGHDLYLYNGGRRYFGGFSQILRIRSVFE